jgi:hypothetical protein
LRSADGGPLAAARRIRVYHGFGDPEVRIAGKLRTIGREEVVTR